MKLLDFKNEIKVLDVAALTAKAKALESEIGDLVLDKNMNKLKDLKSVFKKKKELARVFTVLSQKMMIRLLESKESEAEEESNASKSKDKKGAIKK